MKIEIPNKLRIGGQEIKITYPEDLEGKLGACCVATGVLKIAETFDGKKQSQSSKVNTFYHELVHLVLDTMGRGDLSSDEVFVSTFSSFLFESILNFDYNLNENLEDETV